MPNDFKRLTFRGSLGVRINWWKKYGILSYCVCSDMDVMKRYDAGLGEVRMADLIGCQAAQRCPLPDQ